MDRTVSFPRLASLALCLAAGTSACADAPDRELDAELPGGASVIRLAITEGSSAGAFVEVTLSNTGTCGLSFTTAVTTANGGPSWLTVFSEETYIPPSSTEVLQVSVQVIGTTFPSWSLVPGTYTGTIVVEAFCVEDGDPAVGSPLSISVNLTVTPNAAVLEADDDTIAIDLVTLQDTWSETASAGAPSPRYDHTATWTGSFMFVFGGTDGSTPFATFADGALYQPLNNTWNPVPAGPTTRTLHTAIAFQTDVGPFVVLWGGLDAEGSVLDTGEYFAVLPELYTSIQTTGAPAARYEHSAVSDGEGNMYVWGGAGMSGLLDTGGVYNLRDDAWSAVAPTTGAPSPRRRHVALWIGERMFVFGGLGEGSCANNGALYDPSTSSWTPTCRGPARW